MNGDIIDCLLITFSILSGWIAAVICNVKWASFLDETTDKWNELCDGLFKELQEARRANDDRLIN